MLSIPSFTITDNETAGRPAIFLFTQTKRFFLLLLINIFSPFKHEKQQLSRTAQKPIKKKSIGIT